MKDNVKFFFFSVLFVGIAMVLMDAANAFAINAPSSGSFAYDLYDIAVEKILKGPIGYVGGMAAMALGAVALIGGRVFAAVPAVLGGAALLKADTLIQGIGLIF